MLTKYDITLSFPLGAKFYNNINTLIYKKLMEFIHHLTCINKDGKCKDCPLQDKCQYYHLTGENFSFYPGIIIENSPFTKRLLRQNDELQLVIYLIGECNVSSGYINLFFEEYLNHHIAGSFFLIKQLEYSQIKLSKIKRNTLSFSSLFEKDSFKSVYNNMMIYYRNNYGMDLSVLEDDYEMLNTIESSLEPIKFKTRYIKPKGIICQSIIISEEIEDIIFYTGLGRYNYMGGGRIEN